MSPSSGSKQADSIPASRRSSSCATPYTLTSSNSLDERSTEKEADRMGLTRRKDSYYVEFRVLDDGKALKLSNGGGGQLKRWKVGSLNKTVAKQQEAIIKTKLLSGQVPSPLIERAQS